VLVAFSHHQFSQIRGRQPYSIVRKILYVITWIGVRQALNAPTFSAGLISVSFAFGFLLGSLLGLLIGLVAIGILRAGRL
jgi:hypothetical protein